ncbi:F-box/WD repeat-containing protein 10-like [Polymixia lowei]
MSDSEDPALMVVPRSSASMSGVSRYRDFIRSLPVHLAKRILGLLDKHTLRCCRNVSLHWRYLTEDTTEDISAKRARWNQIMLMQSNRNNRLISDIYANVLEVLVPIKDDEEGDIPSNVQKDTPFAAAYANVKTKPVQMEERNVYCGVYTATVLLEKEDPYRVADYGGRQLVATGSKDRRVHLLNVASKEEVTPVIKGHAGSVRAVLLCEDRGLVISAGYDLSIRCWNLRTKACVMLLCGHTDTINCLDIHGDKLVSGAKDSKVKVWDLQTGKCFEKLKFRHPGSVQCVKINATLVHSSCDKGLVKIWDMENASLLRVIHAHRSSVNCLFFDRWHLLSGDSDGQVMAWSTNCDTKKCLMIFHHPKEVQSLTLAFLRVITGCMDGKIRIFNFLTGDCLRVIKAEGKLSPILSLHFHDNNVLVNTTSSVLLYQFVKVSWVYAGSGEGGQRGVAVGQAGSATEKSFTSLRKFPHAFVRAERMAQVGSPNRKIYGCNGAKPERAELSHHARSLSAPRMRRAQDAQQESMRPATWSKLQSYRRSTAYIDLQPEFIAKPPSAISPGRPVSGWSQETTRIPSYTPKVREFSETSKMSVILSERAASERVKKRGLHHPLTTEHILLRVNAIQQAQRTDEASVNMELNARLRDAWTSPPPGDPLLSSLQDANPQLGSPRALKPSSRTQKPPPPQEVFNGVTKTYVPVFTRSKDHKTGNTLHGRAASTVPVAAIQRPQTGDCPVDHRPRSVCGKTRPHTAGTHMAVRKPGALTTSAEEEPQAPERMLMSTMHKQLGRHVKFETPGAPMPKTNLMDPFREQGGFRLLTETQLREYVRAQRESMQSSEQKSTKNNQEKERKLAWIMKVKGLPDGDFTNEGRVYTPESGHGVPN